MASRPIPVKTPEGQAELTDRRRGLGQRYRTVLLLVDGRRSEQEVRSQALQAGAGESCFVELVEMGLIGVLRPSPPPERDGDGDRSVLPASTLQHDSVLGDSRLGDSMLRDSESPEGARTFDVSLEEAREILMHALRTEAPVAGALTLRRVRRARTRDELTGLIDEVETRIVKPYRSLAAQQVLRRARLLLDTRVDHLPAA